MMKLILTFSLIIIIIICQALYDKSWENYKKEYDKKYLSPEEERKRYETFLETKKEIDGHNKRYDAGLETWTQGLNEFSDLTEIEFEEMYLGLENVDDEDFFLGRSSTHDFLLSALFSYKDTVLDVLKYSYCKKSPSIPPVNKVAPRSIDWRSKGMVSPVKSQKGCNGCWSFAATGAIESQILIQKRRNISLSEQQLNECSESFGNKPCGLGKVEKAFKYVATYGIMSTKDYPFTFPQNHKIGPCKYDESKIVTKLNTFMQVYDELELKDLVGTRGPVAIPMNFQVRNYNSGIWDREVENCIGKNNHVVLIVGYGREKRSDFWLVKNSYGRRWGNNGYFKIRRNNGLCNIGQYGVLPVLSFINLD